MSIGVRIALTSWASGACFGVAAPGAGGGLPATGGGAGAGGAALARGIDSSLAATLSAASMPADSKAAGAPGGMAGIGSGLRAAASMEYERDALQAVVLASNVDRIQKGNVRRIDSSGADSSCP